MFMSFPNWILTNHHHSLPILYHRKSHGNPKYNRILKGGWWFPHMVSKAPSYPLPSNTPPKNPTKVWLRLRKSWRFRLAGLMATDSMDRRHTRCRGLAKLKKHSEGKLTWEMIVESNIFIDSCLFRVIITGIIHNSSIYHLQNERMSPEKVSNFFEGNFIGNQSSIFRGNNR